MLKLALRWVHGSEQFCPTLSWHLLPVIIDHAGGGVGNEPVHVEVLQKGRLLSLLPVAYMNKRVVVCRYTLAI